MRRRSARATQHFRALLLQVPRLLLIHVFEHRFERRRWGLFGHGHGRAEALIDVGDQGLLFAVVPQPAALEVLPQALQRVALGPRLELVRSAVAVWVVARGVAA